MRFFKYHGLGNDFIILDPDDAAFRIGRGLDSDLARRLCDRWFGIGADGVMVVAPAIDPANHVAMELINSDGSWPEMCGNGLRCAVAFAVEVQARTEWPLRVETPGGVKVCWWSRGPDGRVAEVRAAMGAVRFEPAAIPMNSNGPDSHARLSVGAREFDGRGVNTGNPHFVVFGDAAIATATEWGPLLEVHPAFPEKANIEFVEHVGPNHLRATVWERGCGLTFACGTGATAAAAAAVEAGMVAAGAPIRVDLRGGSLQIQIDDGHAEMIGPATFVFRGEIAIDAGKTA